MTTTLDAQSTESLDEAVAALSAAAPAWTATSLTDRIGLLERMLPRIEKVAAAMAADASRAKGYSPESGWAAEDWATGPWALAQNASAFLRTLRRIESTGEPLPAGAVRQQDGRTVVDVFPDSGWDKLLLNGFRAEVWAPQGAGPEDVRGRAGGEYRGRAGEPGVSLVLGAGNIASITALDILYKLYVEGQVAIAKMNPVNAYLQPHFEAVFEEFIEQGWVRFVDGGAAEGAYLAGHEGVGTMHITGSARTHDAIVWGTGPEGEERRAADRPLLDKPFSSELGGVSPCIVAPGPWSAADFRFQAEHIVTSKMNNSGHNCIASQLLVVPQDWDGTGKLLDEVRRVLRELPARPDYYPGAAERLAAVLEAHPGAEVLGENSSRVLVPDLPVSGDPLFEDEVFASALGVVRLPGATTAEFLENAVAFSNEKLPGTLGATLLVHPRTERTEAAAVRTAIADMRYGTLGVNCWSGVGFLLGTTPWGAFPGHTRQDIGSGIGFVHNAYLLEDIEKTVLRAPFAPAPRGVFTGSPSMSPRPPYFVTNKTGLTTMERVTRFTLAPSAAGLPAIFASALRG
jgi:acyl-CoA reductase-like NAD-dependent aldehyde dehydrogenase